MTKNFILRKLLFGKFFIAPHSVYMTKLTSTSCTTEEIIFLTHSGY